MKLSIFAFFVSLVTAFASLGFGQTKQAAPSIEKQWSFLADSSHGCLVGGQYYYKGKADNPHCCFNKDKRWIKFFSYDKDKLSALLIDQLADTAHSGVHVCPYFTATKGELAVYALQKIHKINWYDLDQKYSKYTDGTLEAYEDYYSLQDELQKELARPEGLNLLVRRCKEVLL